MITLISFIYQQRIQQGEHIILKGEWLGLSMDCKLSATTNCSHRTMQYCPHCFNNIKIMLHVQGWFYFVLWQFKLYYSCYFKASVPWIMCWDNSYKQPAWRSNFINLLSSSDYKTLTSMILPKLQKKKNFIRSETYCFLNISFTKHQLTGSYLLRRISTPF